MKLLGITMQIVVGWWIAVCICLVTAICAQAQEWPSERCVSIGGKYLFKGRDETSGEPRSFFNVLWGAPSLWGDPSEIELVHDVSQNTLQIKMYGSKSLRSEPRADGLFKLTCAEGKVNYEYSGEGYSDGQHQKWHYSFWFAKNSEGALIIHATYHHEVALLLFFWDKYKVEQATRFPPANL